MRRVALIGLAALTALACKPGSNAKSGPVVAKGDGIVITADDFKAELDRQSPFIKARYSTLERKKEFLDNMLRMEVLSRAAEKDKELNDDPEVKKAIQRIKISRLYQKRFQQDQGGAAAVSDAEAQKYFDEHKADYFRPKRVRASVIAFNAPAGSPDRAKKLAAAKKALATLKAEEGKNPMAFTKLVAEVSEDQATKSSSGDLGLKSQEDLEKARSKPFAEAVFALKQGETSGVLELPEGLFIVRATSVQEEMNRTLEQVKPQIAQRLARDKKNKELEDWVNGLKQAAKVTIDEKALEAIEVSIAPGTPGGMPAAHPTVTPAPGVGAQPSPATGAAAPQVTPAPVAPSSK